MGLIHDIILPQAAKGVWPCFIEQSALFGGTSDYLSRTPSVAGDRRKWSFSAWVKFNNDAAHTLLVVDGASAAAISQIQAFNGSISLYSDDYAVDLRTGNLLTDYTAWYHVLISVDTTQTVPADRAKFYINNRRVTTFPTEVYPSLNYEMRINSTQEHNIGFRIPSYYLNAYLAETILVDGQALTPDAFGEWSSNVTGLWVPKDYTGTYGTNGFRLDFGNAAALGDDVSGNNNHWTIIGSPAQMLDTPTNNRCTLNALDPATTGTLSNGNLTVSGGNATVTMRPEAGKWSYRKDGVEQLYDADMSGQFNPTLTAGTYDFGASGYAPAAGYNTLCAASLPEPAILRTSTVADVVLREGNGATATVSSLEFQPDFVNIKNRDNAGDWTLFDSERGATKSISTNLAAAEAVDADSLTAFGSAGYTLGSSSLANHSGASFLDLCLKAGPESGFEIVTYTGNGVAGRQIAHSIGKAPTFMITQCTDAPTDWLVFHGALGPTQHLKLNLASAAVTSAAAWNNTPPTSTHFAVGTENNGNSRTYVAYLFTDSDIFRAFSCTGNGVTDGPFVHLGGRPLAIPFLKNSSAATSWLNADSARDPFNPNERQLYPNLNAAEGVGQWAKFASNGLKVSSTQSGANGNASLIVGLAILQSATKYANAF